MQTEVEALRDIPCAKCLFWEPKRQDQRYCNPVQCEQLTNWLLGEVSRLKQTHLTRASRKGKASQMMSV